MSRSRYCHATVTGLVLLMFTFFAGPLFAQQTSSELYQQGIALYEAGQLEDAQRVLNRADPFQLSREDRLIYYRTLARIGRGEGPDATDQPATTAPAAQPAAPTPTPTAPRPVTADVTEETVLAEHMTPPPAPQPQPQPQPAAQPQPAPAPVVAPAPAPQPVVQRPVSEVDIVEVTAGVVVEPAVEPLPATTSTQPAPQPVVVDEMVVVEETRVEAPAPAPAEDLLTRNRRLHAQQRVTEAREAMDQQQYTLAVRLLDQALAFDPEDLETLALRDQAARRVAQSAPVDALDTTLQTRTLASQQAEAQFSSAMTDARRMKDEGQYDLANERLAAARQTLDRSMGQMPQERVRQLRAEADQFAQEIRVSQQQADTLRTDEARIQQTEDARQTREQALARQQQQVNDLLRRAMTNKRERRYEEALELAEQVLFLDPHNVAGELLKDSIQDDMIYHETARAVRARQRSFAEASLYGFEQTTMQTEVVHYPPDWPQLTQMRLAGMDVGGGESESNRRVALKLQEPITVEFERNELSSVVTFLRNFTGLNFFVNWRALEEAGVMEQTPVSLALRNVPTDQVLELVLNQISPSDLEPITYSIIRGVVHISTRRDLQRTTEIRTYDIRDLLVQVPNFTNAPDFDLGSVLESAGDGTQGGGGGGGGLFDTQDSSLDEDAVAEQLLIEIQELIMDSVGDPLEWSARGGDISSLRELNGNLIVRSTPENHRSIIQLLAQLRETRAVQISVEARFLLVEQGFLEEVGLDWDIAYQNTGGDSQYGFELDQNTQQLAGLGPSDLVAPALGFAFGYSYLDDLQVNVLLKASQKNNQAIRLTAPRVTFFNGQRAYVIVARQVSFVSDLEPIPDAGAFNPTIGVVQSGVVLDVQGTISADRRYVTMTMRPSLATLQRPIRTIPFTGAGTAGDFGQGTTFTGSIEVPELEITQIRTTVSVPDKGTIMLGGQKIVEEVELEAGVPVLSKIPVINRFFTNTSMIKDERTLLILCKPTIVIQSELEDQLFPGLGDDPTSFNLGGF